MRVIRRCLALAAATAFVACGEPTPPAVQSTADPERGRLLLRQFGCGTCHRIPGVAAAEGDTGPPLDGMARRVYIAGTVPNTQENMARFIRAPQSMKPQTLMPDLRVGEAHAADMVAYLWRRE
jgi:cytochrome c